MEGQWRDLFPHFLAYSLISLVRHPSSLRVIVVCSVPTNSIYSVSLRLRTKWQSARWAPISRCLGIFFIQMTPKRWCYVRKISCSGTRNNRFFVDNILIEYIPRPSLISPIVTPVEVIRYLGRWLFPRTKIFLAPHLFSHFFKVVLRNIGL